MLNKYDILGVQIDRVDRKEVEQKFSYWLTERSVSFHQVVTINPEFIMEAQENEQFRTVLRTAALSLADGFGILCASFFLYGKRLERLTGVHATLLLAQLAEKYQKKVYLIGGLSGVAEKCAKKFQEQFPGLNIVGAEEGIPKNYELRITNYELLNQEICKKITESGAEVLLVAFGAPKQELWISDNKQFLPIIRIAIGVGGTFDYLSGLVPYSPRIFRIIGLEWLFRLFMEPKRINRIITAVIRFPLAVFFYKIKSIIN